MKNNTPTYVASILSFVSLILGVLKIIPYFNKSGNPDHVWIVFIVTAFPLMIFIYNIAGAGESAKSVAANSYAMVVSVPAIIAAIYLGMWVSAICLIICSIFIIKQLFLDSEDQKNSHH